MPVRTTHEDRVAGVERDGVAVELSRSDIVLGCRARCKRRERQQTDDDEGGSSAAQATTYQRTPCSPRP